MSFNDEYQGAFSISRIIAFLDRFTRFSLFFIVQQRYRFVPGDFFAAMYRCLSREPSRHLTYKYNYLAFIYERKLSSLAYARLPGGLILASHAKFHSKLKFLS